MAAIDFSIYFQSMHPPRGNSETLEISDPEQLAVLKDMTDEQLNKYLETIFKAVAAVIKRKHSLIEQPDKDEESFKEGVFNAIEKTLEERANHLNALAIHNASYGDMGTARSNRVEADKITSLLEDFRILTLSL